MVKVDSKKLKNFIQANKQTATIVAVALLLTAALLAVRAGAPFAGFESEGASLSGNAVVKNASDASAGQYVEFSAGSSGGGSGGSVGPTSSITCSSGVAINPGDNWQSKVDANGSGTTFCIKAGVHRLQSVKPKNNQKFIGEVGAVMSGAKVLTGWQQSGSDWFVSGQTQGLSSSGYGGCSDGFPRCGNPEDLFVNGSRYHHVANRSDLASGRWFFDYGADRIYIRDNPSGKNIETSVTPHAFYGGGITGVHVRNLIIEKYATPGQDGAVGEYGSTGSWLVERNEIRYNHACGAKIANSNAKTLYNYFHNNGMIGACGGGFGNLVEGNEMAHNGKLGFTGGYAAGGKWVHADDLVIRNNYAHNNKYPGLWADGNVINITFEDNTVINNAHMGIFYEIGHKATIRNNYVEGNGFGGGAWPDGGGIMLNTSQDVEIYGNTVVNNRQGIAIVGWDRSSANTKYGEYVARNINVYDNNIKMEEGYTGAHGSNVEYNTIKFTNNTYELKGHTTYFRFNLPKDSMYNWSQWQGIGQDTNGSFTNY